jgi:hypothetical protein
MNPLQPKTDIIPSWTEERILYSYPSVSVVLNSRNPPVNDLLESHAEEGLDFEEIVVGRELGEAVVAHEDDVFVHVGCGNDAAKLLDDFLQLLELLAEGVGRIGRGAEDVRRRAVLARAALRRARE